MDSAAGVTVPLRLCASEHLPPTREQNPSLQWQYSRPCTWWRSHTHFLSHSLCELGIQAQLSYIFCIDSQGHSRDMSRELRSHLKFRLGKGRAQARCDQWSHQPGGCSASGCGWRFQPSRASLTGHLYFCQSSQTRRNSACQQDRSHGL